MTKELQKEILKWQKSASRRRESGVFIVEGIKMFREIPVERLLHVVVSNTFIKENPADAAMAEAMASVSGKGDFSVVPDPVYEKISDTETPQGILAVVKSFSYTLEEVLQEKNGLYMLLENLQDPGNLGTILRSGEAAGVSGIIMNQGCVDIYNPKVIRSTMGSLFRVKFVTVPNLQEVVSEIRRLGGRTYAAHLRESSDYDVPDYRTLTGFLIGNESKGLTEDLTDAADACIKIPMKGRVESLNAAMAATILLYEAARQRKS